MGLTSSPLGPSFVQMGVYRSEAWQRRLYFYTEVYSLYDTDIFYPRIKYWKIFSSKFLKCEKHIAAHVTNNGAEFML